MKSLFLVRSNPVAGQEAEFNRWYDQVHLKEVVQIEGFLSAQRFKLDSSQLTDHQPHGYLAIYEIDSNDVAATLANLRAATHLQPSDAIDYSDMQVSVFTSCGDVVTAPD